MKDLRTIIIEDNIKIQNSSKKQEYGEVFYPNNNDVTKVFLTSLP